MRKASEGFTLIELVVVIVILGILAATALPRYIQAQQQARIAKAQGIYGGVRAAAALAHAGCVLDIATNPAPTCTTVGGTANMEGATVQMTNQYPTANLTTTSPGGVLLAAQLAAATDAVAVSLAGTTVNIDINGGTAPNCRVSYTQAGAGASPTIAVVTTGC